MSLNTLSAGPAAARHNNEELATATRSCSGERQPLLTPTNDRPSPTAVKPSDGGAQAWLFVLAGFFVFVNSWGLSSTFGAFLEHYRTELLPESSPSALSWIGSAQATFVTIVGLVTGPLTDRGYLRPVMIIGHSMVVFGMLSLSFSTEYYQVMLSQGFCVGLGAGAINIPAFAIISSKFTTWRPIALGCASTGASIGGIIFPLMFRRLAPQIGFALAIRAIALVNLVFAIPTLAIYCRHAGVRSPTAKLVIDPRGFVEPIFVVKLGTSTKFAFDLLAISNAASFFGRTVPYLLGTHVTPIQILIFWEIVGIVLLFSWIAVDSVVGMIIWTVSWGFLSGVLVTAPAASTAHPTLSPSLDVIGARLGMSWSTAAVGVLIGAPIAATLADVANADFIHAQLFGGIVMTVAAILMTVPLAAAHRYNKQKLRIFALYPIGELPGGQVWSNGNSVGTLSSVPGSNMELNATTLHMDDFTVVSSEGGPYALSARGMLETDDGHFISVTGRGLLPNTPHVQAVIANNTGVKPTKWGELDAITTWSFQASGKYSDLTEAIFFANIRLLPSDNADTAAYAEYRLSKVLPGSLCQSSVVDKASDVGNDYESPWLAAEL
ncbi:hypothetical protein GQX73_g456 [Xylaria multiplex]|uniref:Major facilitator superfamily (MFS) profile domain-containing protein n=1 Tax=Xylaria multiplex TaxID=323545 RepID=A0A7C8IV74_9PEZI|nr:hypothetical protein GQX73_g456 [Xylaria multiplex]